MSIPSSVASCGGLTLFNNNRGVLNTLTTNELTQLQRDAEAYATAVSTIRNDRNARSLDPTSVVPERLNDQELAAQITQIQRLITDLENDIQGETRYATDLRAGIEQRLVQLQQQESDLVQKQQLIKTRDRMLQIAMEKNIYKRKLIYVLISVILVIIVFMMLGYVAYRRGFKVNNFGNKGLSNLSV